MSAVPGITQKEAVKYINETRSEATAGEHCSERDGGANSMGRMRAPDVIDPYRMSKARRKNPDWSLTRSEEPDGDGCGCM